MSEPFDVLLADPPWCYDNKNTGGSMKSGSAAKYPTLTVAQLQGMWQGVRSITHPGSVLFLWVTTPMKPEGLSVMKSWGFAYKTTIYWFKLRHYGMGFWFRGGVEELLVGARPRAKALRCQERNVIEAQPTRHSRKPDESYDLIECATPGMTRAELFATRRRPGWSAWGNEVECDFSLDVPAHPS